jgi:transmembrane sensor
MFKDRSTIAPQIIDEASEWFVTMREPSTSTEEREAFAEWLRASPVHVSAYLEIARVWADASRIDRDLFTDLPPSDAFPANVIALPTDGAQPRRRPVVAERKRRRIAVAFAASLLLALIVGGAWLYANRATAYITDIAEQRTITLEDGTIVRLNSRSEFKVRMTPEQRRIELVAGQALFEVAHDANRPFIVFSGNSAVRAVGTQFDVNRKQSGTTVTVIEGRVRLDPVSPSAHRAATPSPPEVFLSAGEQIHVASSGEMEKTAKPNTAAAISWLQQELIFEGQPLSDVVEEFNRYTRTPLVLSDASLGELRINAVFHTTNPDSLLRFISRYDNVRIERAGAEIRISRRK